MRGGKTIVLRLLPGTTDWLCDLLQLGWTSFRDAASAPIGILKHTGKEIQNQAQPDDLNDGSGIFGTFHVLPSYRKGCGSSDHLLRPYLGTCAV